MELGPITKLLVFNGEVWKDFILFFYLAHKWIGVRVRAFVLEFKAHQLSLFTAGKVSFGIIIVLKI